MMIDLPKQTRWRTAAIFGWLSFALSLVALYATTRGYTYSDCILDHYSDARTRAALSTIRQACEAKYPTRP